jgi:hypothetical protein
MAVLFFIYFYLFNAHILYKLKKHVESGDYLNIVGDWIKEAAIQMKAMGYAAIRTARTRAAANVTTDVIKIANIRSLWTTWENCPSKLAPGHFAVFFPKDAVRRHCKMPKCNRQIHIYCRKFDVPLCCDDIGGPIVLNFFTHVVTFNIKVDLIIYILQYLIFMLYITFV